MTLSRPRTVPQTRRELNHVTDAANRRSPRTGSVARLVYPPLGQPRTFPLGASRGWRRAPGRTLRLFAERAADFIAWSSGLRALLNVLAARVEPGSQSRRDSAESLESSGGLHVHNMRSAHGKVREAINSKLSGA
jgi:hypothetical protein